MSINRGVIYCVTGMDRIRYDEVLASALSIRRYAPSLSITLFTDNVEFRNEVFDDVLTVEPHMKGNPFFRRIQAVNRSPYDQTLALDSDTMVVDSSFIEVYDLLDRFDMAAAHTPIRTTTLTDEIPMSFTQVNCGVILYKKSKNSLMMLKKWEELMATGESKWLDPDDQGCFRYCLWHSDVRIATLSPEYNLRTPYPSFIGEGAKVAIIHGKEYDCENFPRELNDNTCNRIVLPCANYVINGATIYIEKSKLALFFKVVKKVYDMSSVLWKRHIERNN